MDVKTVLNQAKSVIAVVDKWDDTAIAVLKSIASLPFAPVWLKTAAFLIEKYEKAIIEKGTATVEFLQSLLGGMEKAEELGENKEFDSKEQKSEEKLNIALAEVKPLIEQEQKEKDVIDTIQGVAEKASGIIGLIKSFKEMF